MLRASATSKRHLLGAFFLVPAREHSEKTAGVFSGCFSILCQGILQLLIDFGIGLIQKPLPFSIQGIPRTAVRPHGYMVYPAVVHCLHGDVVLGRCLLDEYPPLSGPLRHSVIRSFRAVSERVTSFSPAISWIRTSSVTVNSPEIPSGKL